MKGSSCGTLDEADLLLVQTEGSLVRLLLSLIVVPELLFGLLIGENDCGRHGGGGVECLGGLRKYLLLLNCEAKQKENESYDRVTRPSSHDRTRSHVAVEN